jgi:hypothetical protein
LVYTAHLIARCQELLGKAADAAEDEVYATRVAMHAQGFKNAAQYVQMRDAINRGDFAQAKDTYGDLLARNQTLVEAGHSNHYTPRYIQRFLGRIVESGAAATAPPSKVLKVLPDMWRLAYDESDIGIQKGYHRQDFDDSKWMEVATYGKTLDAQGLPDKKTVMWYRTSLDVPPHSGRLSLFFAEIDGTTVVYVNGKEVSEQPKRREPFEVDITDVVHMGSNVVVVRVDHSRITELFLGGIIRPVLLIERIE